MGYALWSVLTVHVGQGHKFEICRVFQAQADQLEEINHRNLSLIGVPRASAIGTRLFDR